MKIDLEELERKAKAATPGPWAWREDGSAITDSADQLVLWSSDSVEYDTTVTASIHDRAHLVAAAPTAVLALVARIRELEQALTALVDECALGSDEPDEYNHERAIITKGVVLP